MNSTLWRSNHQWNKIEDKKFPHARSADNQQIVGSTVLDMTSLVFPAIGALLILVFGGLLLSSTNSCCSRGRKRKRNNKNEDDEGINFTFLTRSIVFPRLSPVLQQENNDVVEAVMATYSNLPQYAPVHDELAGSAGTISITKPQTRDVCLSPIHEAPSHFKIPVNIVKDENDLSGLEDGAVTQQACSHSNESSTKVEDKRLASSAMATRIASDQNDVQMSRSKSAPLKRSFDTNTQQEDLSLDEQLGLDTSQDSVRSVAQRGYNDVGRCTALSLDEQLALDTSHGSVRSVAQRGYNDVGRCTALSLDEQLALDTSQDSVRSVAQRDCNDVERWSPGSYNKPCDVVSLADDRMTSPVTELQIQKSGIGEIVPGQVLLDNSFQWKRPAKLSKKDKLEILKCLQPKIDNKQQQQLLDNQTENNNNRSEENDVNRICQECSPNVAVMLNDDHCTKGGRLSRLEVVRAPSALCIHGNKCHSQCRTTGHVTDNPGGMDHHLNDSGRGASCFAESFRHSTSMLRGASAFGEPTRGASVFGEHAIESRDMLYYTADIADVRGASSFGGNNFYCSSKRQPPEDVIRTYGEATRCWVTGVSGQDTNDMRGASGFGESCDRLSVAGTASVTLSMAVQSDKEDFMEDNDSLENTVAKTHVANQPKEINLEGATERSLVQQNNDANNDQGEGNECCECGSAGQNTTEVTLQPDKRLCSVSNDDVQSISLPQHGNKRSLRDNIIKRKVIDAKGRADVPEDGPDRTSIPKTTVTKTTRDTKMSLGKDPRVLTGLLKALQREKLQKTSKKKENLPTSLQNRCPPLETSNVHGNHSLENTNIDAMMKDGRIKQFVGKIKVCLFYTRSDTDTPVLYATVLKAYSLRQEYVKPKEGFLVEMLVSTRDNSTQKSKVIKEYKNSLVFNHLFHVPSIKTRELQISALKLMLVSGRSHECVGIANVPLVDLVSRDKIKKTYLLRRANSASHDIQSSELSPPVPVGAVCVGLKYNSVEEKLLVHIIKVRGLPAVSSTGETDPYVLVTLKDDGSTIEERMTLTKWRQRNPVFNVKYVLEVNRDRVETCSLLLRVMNNAAYHSLIGTVKIGMDSLEDSGRCHWNNIVTKPGDFEERWHKLINKAPDIKIQT